MRITDLTCAVIGGQPTIRIATDAGITGDAGAEVAKHYIKPHVEFYRTYIVGEDPRDVQRVVGRFRKVRGRVRMYRTGSYETRPVQPAEFPKTVRRALADPAGWTIIKHGVGFHSSIPVQIPGLHYGDPRTGPPHPNGGLLTDRELQTLHVRAGFPDKERLDALAKRRSTHRGV